MRLPSPVPRVPVHVQHVEQALAWARFRGLHAVEIEFEEIAAIGVRCLLQADHAIPAIVDRAEDQGWGAAPLMPVAKSMLFCASSA